VTTTYTVTALTDANCTAQAGDRTGSALVTVNTAPAITAQPQSQTVNEGANVTFSVTASGTAPFAYQWRKGGVDISGATASTLNLTAVTTNDAGSYDVVVNNSCGSATSAAATLTVTVNTLPAPWQTMDIGAVGIAGSATHSSGTYTVKGSGTGITGTSDQFRYVYQTMSGDGSITARLTSQSGSTTASLAGVMIREATTTGSTFAGVWRRGSGNNNMRAVRRTSTGGSITSTSSSSQTPPNCWVRITRTGSSFAMQRSSNGTSWTTINTSTITMATDITVGILVTSGSNTVLDTDVFDNVTVVP
jgi:regulation of enolase protein 1 (concanavalin A-like superfamily)